MNMKRTHRWMVGSLFLAACSAWGQQTNATPRPLPDGTFRFESYANNVRVLPPLVADFQLGVSRFSGSGTIRNGKVSGTLTCTDEFRIPRHQVRSLTATIIDGTYNEIGDARQFVLTVKITRSSHPDDEAAPGLIGTLELQDSPVLLRNKQPDDFIRIGGWKGEVRTHVHGWNNDDPGPRAEPPTGGKGGGQWADVEINVRTDNNILGRWRRTDNSAVVFTKRGSGIVGHIETLGPLGSFGFSVGEETFRLAPSQNGQYAGEVKWRTTSGEQRWQPTTQVVKGNKMQGAGEWVRIP